MDISRRTVCIGAAATAVSLLQPGFARATQTASSGPKLDVLVLGAGVSGLNCAWLLEQQGLKVAVLEARQRVGGRVLTLFDQPGHPELGFNAMADGYGRSIDAAQRAGLALFDIGARYRQDPPQTLVLGGQVLARDEWARSPLNPFPDALKTAMPWEITGRLLSANNPLADWQDWIDPKNAALDVSFRDFLVAQGLGDPAIRLAYGTLPAHGTSADDVSALMMAFNDGWTRSQAAIGSRSLAIKGGNQLLPMAMANLLKGDVLLGKQVVQIASDDDAASVICADGSIYRAARVICSLPFSTLRRIAIAPGLSGRQARAVATLPYQPLSMAFLTVKEPFWEEDGLSPAMWTDGVLGMVIPQKFGSTDSEITGLVVQARGDLARHWDRLGRETALRQIVSALEAVRPAARGKVTAAAFHSWEAEAFNAGDWAYFQPGQVSAFAAVMAQPAGRIHFCGEHTALSNRGLEGASESSERVALEVLTL